VLESFRLADYENSLQMNLLFVRRWRHGRIHGRLILAKHQALGDEQKENKQRDKEE
jgi:hypothetical protein